MFQHGHQVSEDLRRVKFIGQAVPHRYARVLPQFFNDLLTKTAILNAVIHPAQHAGGIFHGFFMPNLRAAWPEIGHLCALIECADLKRAAGAGGGFFEN